eukprot:CAMPEP_0117647908 /NCGR_PEP_ID=MMETSP0804-20121206/100_1 /TAXON_ID=1074897 /ORGANISM="Tetraselmis astigmatica, Strain CCMP880" /LENGTH=254 /DNA_ID=CAMNT_0005453431 /DNA_START=164 /DNA_END=928 /DNA_ORIENTATION=+
MHSLAGRSNLARAFGTHTVSDPKLVEAGSKAHAGIQDPFHIPEPMHRKDSLFLDQLRATNLTLPLTGQVIIGRVLDVDKKSILIDTGFKVHQRFMKKELQPHCLAARGNFQDIPLDDPPSDFMVGDVLHLVVRNPSTPYGDMQLEAQEQKTEARLQAVVAEIEMARQADRPVMGRVLNAVNGGYAVGIGGIVGFLPLSRASLNTVKKMGVLQPFLVISCDQEANRINLVVTDPYPKPRAKRIIKTRLDVKDIEA